MYLSGLQLCNFRNFKSSCFIFKKGANTIIGENDAGKSNAITGLRILLDNMFLYNTKRLKESDFSYSLDSWRGHWIIISATFSDITDVDKESEICASLVIDDKENVDLISSLISSDCREQGVVTLFIRPQKSIRQKLFEASGNQDAFNKVRQSIRLTDYEFYFTAKSKANFCDKELYKNIVGDFDSFLVYNPEDDDASILGHKVTIADVQNHISLVHIDALRDVFREINIPRNPIRRIIETIESEIDPKNIDAVKEKISELNNSITNITEVGIIGRGLNQKLLDILGVVYSPEIALTSELSDEINVLSRFISMKPKNEDNLNLLGLGHLNMIYLALKIVEFEACRSRELLNIMVIEEPEAHIHSHIQKTLFKNLSVAKNYTQVIMTTHSVHLAESSEISHMNILKTLNKESIAMQPMNNLDKFGKENLKKKCLSLTNCIERYLDAKRNVLLFSKGVMLVEGDAEEILLPNIVKTALGLNLDEIGIGLVNVGSTAFEYVASVFDDDRVQRFCAIVSDLDRQAVSISSSHYSKAAEEKGNERKKKLECLYKTNQWIEMFYAEHTFEIELLKYCNNYKYFILLLDKIYTQRATIERNKEALKNKNTQSEAILSILKKEGKGWIATIMSEVVDYNIEIPDYIMDALAFASQETMNLQIYKKMLLYSLSLYEENAELQNHIELLRKAKSEVELSKFILNILTFYENNIAVKFIKRCEAYNKYLIVSEKDD